MSNPLTLTHEQITFLRQHHDEIEHALDTLERDYRDQSLANLLHSSGYHDLFNGMIWDEILDRYEESPEYDPRLRQQLKLKLAQDIETGFVPVQEHITTQKASTPSLNDRDLGNLGVVRLADLMSVVDDK